MKSAPTGRWFREPTMILVCCVLAFAVTSGFTMLLLSVSHRDALVVTDQSYQQWRDSMRATATVPVEDE